MLLFNVSKERGFTLIESLFVVAIAVILMSIAIPSLVAAQNRARLAQATDLVIATLQEAQAESMRRNQSCTLILNKIDRKIQSQSGCLSSGDKYLPSGITLNYTGTSDKIQYGIRGNTTSNKSIVLMIKDSPKNAECLTISAPLGIIRLGSYNEKKNTCDKLNT